MAQRGEEWYHPVEMREKDSTDCPIMVKGGPHVMVAILSRTSGYDSLDSNIQSLCHMYGLTFEHDDSYLRDLTIRNAYWMHTTRQMDWQMEILLIIT
jgi:hypothetical protein